MVERLREAIEKARQQRASATPAATEAGAAPPPPAPASSSAAWDAIPLLDVDPDRLVAARIISATKSDPSYAVFDVMRTRILRACRDHGWSRLAVTSPDKGNGKSFVALNLAYSLSRNRGLKTVLIELDLRRPSMRAMLRLDAAPTVTDYLMGTTPLENGLVRLAPNFALGVAHRAMRDSAELLHSASFANQIKALVDRLKPDLLICDLPPIFVGDDVLGFLSNVDALILVAGAGETSANEIRECERLISGAANFLGVVLNKAERADLADYKATYGAEYVTD